MACRGSGVRVSLAPFLKTLSMKVFEAAERPLFSAFLRIVSEPLNVEQVVNRPDRPPALQGLDPATPCGTRSMVPLALERALGLLS